MTISLVTYVGAPEDIEATLLSLGRMRVAGMVRVFDEMRQAIAVTLIPVVEQFGASMRALAEAMRG